jgi:hypothetical protein
MTNAIIIHNKQIILGRPIPDKISV